MVPNRSHSFEGWQGSLRKVRSSTALRGWAVCGRSVTRVRRLAIEPQLLGRHP